MSADGLKGTYAKATSSFWKQLTQELPVIVLVTDFGLVGPYLGQMKMVLRRDAPEVDVIDLFADAPAFDPQAAAYLLGAYVAVFPAGSVFLCVVDPGVGGDRLPCVVRAGGRWFVGPDNGLFEMVIRRACHVRAWRIDWQPQRLSSTFHGRDLFAPVAARLARGAPPPGAPVDVKAIRREEWPDDLPRIVYIDGYGNAMTGLRAALLPERASLRVAGRTLRRARTYSDLPVGGAFCYENANGLLEIAVNRGRAADVLGVSVGASVSVEP
jgi:S-adenosyl-L-methionine hydrolase (adenosine-forming)